MKLTLEEKTAVSRLLTDDLSLSGSLKVYWPWLVPLLGLVGYSVYSQDVVSGVFANTTFGFYMLWFLWASSKEGIKLQSALKKYEAEVSALGE